MRCEKCCLLFPHSSPIALVLPKALQLGWVFKAMVWIVDEATPFLVLLSYEASDINAFVRATVFRSVKVAIVNIRMQFPGWLSGQQKCSL